MAKFCGNCGSRIDESGKCPKCNLVPTENLQGTSNNVRGENIPNPLPTPTPKKAFSDFKKKSKIVFIITIVLLSVYTILLITLASLTYFNKINLPFLNDILVYMGIKDEEKEHLPVESQTGNEGKSNTQSENEEEDPELNGEYRVTPPDADKYFQDNSKLISEIKAPDSENSHTEAETYNNFRERGFENFPIVTNYTMNGEYINETEISSYSSTKHPMYQMIYTTPTGDVWTVLEINGTMMATPLSYNLQSNSNIPVIISETDTITSYDSTTGKYYINTPNLTVAKLKKVDRIDAETLNRLTIGEMEK